MSRKRLLSIVPVLGICLGLIFGAGANRLLANGNAVNSVAGIMNYQGYLTDSSGSPYTGPADLRFALYDTSSGGTELWGESYDDVPVEDGYFTVQLGSQDPLMPSDFSSDTRYLQVSVDITGTGTLTDLPRQRLASVPYALQAGAAPWSGLSGVPAGFADGIDNTGVDYANVVVVAKSGGDYTSITAAMDAISPTSSSPYLVYVAPGSYSEQVTVKEYVHLMGSGPHTTIITGAYTGNVSTPDSAVVTMGANTQLSQIGVVNTGAGTTNGDNSVAVFINQGNGWTELSHVHARADGAGGARHAGIYASGGQSRMNQVYAKASGANAAAAGGGINWGLFSNAHDGTIDSSTFYADGSAGGTATGAVVNSGDSHYTNVTLRAANASSERSLNRANGNLRIYHSVLEGNDGVIQTNGNTTVTYIGSSMVEGGATATFGTVRCAQSYDENFNDVAGNCN